MKRIMPPHHNEWNWANYAYTLVALLVQSHAFPTVLIPIAWKTEISFIVLLYWFQLNPKVNWSKTKVELNISQLTPTKTTQLGRHETVTEDLPNPWDPRFNPDVLKNRWLDPIPQCAAGRPSNLLSHQEITLISWTLSKGMRFTLIF